SVDFELGYLQQERQTAADWYRSMVEKDAEHRISAEQMDQVEREFNQKLDDIDKREDSLLGAEGALRRARVPYKKRR
ncbi:MAG TPA: hypothetical protein VKA50_03575, partial [Gammaproteobacteria bacterium]|nr:hypothetical protein [Gammaproteobacteria bacterium]